jgi:hypothetical protein
MDGGTLSETLRIEEPFAEDSSERQWQGGFLLLWLAVIELPSRYTWFVACIVDAFVAVKAWSELGGSCSACEVDSCCWWLTVIELPCGFKADGA